MVHGAGLTILPDVALWFVPRMAASCQSFDQARLQCLRYLSQAAWAAQHEGRKLMLATFLATHDGPAEPNILHLFEAGALRVRGRPPPVDVKMFLEAMWKRFGGDAAERLTQLACGHPAYRRALEDGHDSEIAFDAQGQDTAA